MPSLVREGRREGLGGGRIENRTDAEQGRRVDRLELDLLADQLAAVRGGGHREADDRLGWLRLAVPSSSLVPEHGDAAPERLLDGLDRLAVLVGELDGHHHRVVLEDFAELTELDLLVEAGQMFGQRGTGLVPGRTRLAGQDEEDEPAESAASSP